MPRTRRSLLGDPSWEGSGSGWMMASGTCGLTRPPTTRTRPCTRPSLRTRPARLREEAETLKQESEAVALAAEANRNVAASSGGRG